MALPAVVSSRWIHRYLGLVLSPYFLWMGLSGILLNHQECFTGVSLPLRVMGAEHLYRKWSRGACRGMIFAGPHRDTAYLYGKEGVWRSTGDEPFAPLNVGLPEGVARDVATLLAIQPASGDEPVLLAGGDAGLWRWMPNPGRWDEVLLPGKPHRIVKILSVPQGILIVTTSGAYLGDRAVADSGWELREVALQRAAAPDRVDGIHYAFALHSGEAWGAAAVFLMDLAGVGMIFLGVTGVLMWYRPWRLRHRRAASSKPRRRSGVLAFCHRYHRSLGTWGTPLLLASTLSGLALCIPVIMVWLGKSIDPKWAPGLRHDAPWHDQIQSALYDSARGKIVLAGEGYWEGPADLAEPFTRLSGGPPGNVMGLEVFALDADGSYLVGHFGGLFRWDRTTGEVAELGDADTNRPRFGPTGGLMSTAAFRDPQGRLWACHFREGLRCLDDPSANYPMPAQVVAEGRLPLWLFLHYLHNGRIWSVLPVPLRLLFALLAAAAASGVMLTGFYDWLDERGRRKSRRNSG